MRLQVGYHADDLTTAGLQEIAKLMCDDGSIVINQCNGGKGKGGAASLSRIAKLTGVPVSGPDGEIKGCRVFGGALTSYVTKKPPPPPTPPAKIDIAPLPPGGPVQDPRGGFSDDGIAPVHGGTR